MANFVLSYEPDDVRHTRKNGAEKSKSVKATALRGECGLPSIVPEVHDRRR